MQNEIDNRPTTPESPLAGSLYHASTTVDDLTMALANFSRVTSPEPPFSVTCCCGNDDCDNAKAWLTFKSKLEERLVLSAGNYILLIHVGMLTYISPCSRGRSSVVTKARGIRPTT